MIKKIIFFATLNLLAYSLLSKDYNIISFGAVADGKTLNTLAIQKAIDKAYEDGGGRVIIPEGQFLTGSIVLKSGVEIHLLENAYVLGSTRSSDYIKISRWKALIMADNQNNIAISGERGNRWARSSVSTEH